MASDAGEQGEASALGRALARGVEAAGRHPRAVVGVALACALASIAVVASGRLRIDTDTIRLFPENLPARVAHERFTRLFPDLENALFIVVDAPNAPLAREIARDIATRLRGDPAHFSDAYVPGADPFFERHAFLYRTVDELDDFADRLTRIQPVIGELAAQPTLATLTRLIERGLADLDEAGLEAEQWSAVLDRVGSATVDVFTEHPVALSWEDVLLEGASIEVATRQVVVAQPVLDFAALLPAAAPLAIVRETARSLPGHTRVRVTGNPALAHDETLGLLVDLGLASVGCFAIVAFLLRLAFGSLRLVAASVITLAAGVAIAGAFAALAVGRLNVISLSAGVLFLGLGVDYAIHLGTCYASQRRGGRAHAEAMQRAVEETGPALVLCGLTTAVGFLAFLPTDYRGVAEFGLITAIGLLVLLLLTLTLLPALLAGPLAIDSFGAAPSGRVDRAARALGSAIAARSRAVVAAAVALLLVALALAPRARFEPNIVAMRDPSTESVQAFEDLLADAGDSSPWLANSLAPDEPSARELAERLRALPEVRRAIGLHDYVPDDQAEKLAILSDLALLFDAPRARSVRAPTPAPAASQIAALRALRDALARAELADEGAPTGSVEASVARLRRELDSFLDRTAESDDVGARLRELEQLLLSSLPAHVERLRASLAVGPVDEAQLPARVVRRMRAPTGELRLQTFPREDLASRDAMARFVDAVRAIDPGATGVAVNLVAFGRTTQRAFAEALGAAVAAIALILWLVWRRASEVALALAPLGLAALATVAGMALLGVPFSFFNVVVLPLMLGAGVDAGVHVVERARSVPAAELLATTTARAILYSTLTTLASFGSLALSSHRGLAGLGALLAVGMALTLASNLVVLPALVAAREARRARGDVSSR